MKKEKKSFYSVIFAISIWFIYLSNDASFMMKTIIPLVVLLLIYLVAKKQYKLKITTNSKNLIYFVITIILSTVINCIINYEYIDYNVIIGIVYFLEIFLWFCIITEQDYKRNEIAFIINSFIILAVVASLQVIFLYLAGKTGKLSVVSLLGVKVDANYFSALVSIINVLLFIKILYFNKNKFKLLVNVICLIVMLCGIGLSGSRAALLATILSDILVFIQYIIQNINFKKIVMVFFIIIAMFVGVNIFLKVMPVWIYNRYFVNTYSDNSNNERVELWENAIKGVLKQPILGYGIGIFDKVPEFNTLSSGRKIPPTVPAHNTFLDILVYSGVIGEIIFLIFLYNIFKEFLKKKKRIFIPVILNLLFTSNIIGADKSYYFWSTLILLSIISKVIQKEEEENNEIKTYINDC